MSRPRRLFSGDRLLTAAEVRDSLPLLLAESGLLDHPRWSTVFEDSQPGAPVLVQRLNREDSYYWIVPTLDHHGNRSGVVSFDARFGNYESAMDTRESPVDVNRFQETEEVIDHVLANRIELPSRAGRLLARREGIGVHPTLVWKPCRESLSPFYPFRLITAGSWLMYLRVWDGALFTSLTNDAGGV